MKYRDGDKFERIQKLAGYHGDSRREGQKEKIYHIRESCGKRTRRMAAPRIATAPMPAELSELLRTPMTHDRPISR